MRRIGARDAAPERGDPAKFTGTVVREDVLDPQLEDGMNSTRFSYAPAAWSRWHSHEGEQVLLTLAGSGLVVGEDGRATRVVGGDLLYLAPGERHWHGSAPNEFWFVLAVTATGGTDWHDEVDEEAYRRASAHLAE